MGLKESLRKLFGTSKTVTVAKADELKDKAVHSVETAKEYSKDVVGKLDNAVTEVKAAAKDASVKVKDFGENLKEKAEEAIEKLDEKAAGIVDKLEEKIRGGAVETATAEPETEEPEETVVHAEVAEDQTAEVMPADVVEESNDTAKTLKKDTTEEAV